MNLTRQIKDAFENIITSKIRSILTLLGILVGTASVVALISSGQLATLHALEQFKNLGTDLLAVSIEGGNQSDDNANDTNKLQVNQLNQIRQSSRAILLMAPYTLDYSEISYQGQTLQGSIVGATEDLARINKIGLAKGRFVSFLDKDQAFCVIGNQIAKSLKGLGIINPIGKQIKVGTHFFTIIGVIKPWTENMFMYADLNQSIIIPLGTSLTLSKYVSIQNIIFKLKPDQNLDKVQNNITKAVNLLMPKARLFFRSAKQLINGMEKQQQTFTLMLGAIGGISLIVGGIGVMNIMLVSVIERRREIGVRMAIGARRRDIQLMFLTEAIVLALMGGIIGIIVGISVSLGVALFSRWTFHLFLLPPTIGFLVSALVGIFFGYYPARKASQLDPIEVLRSD